MRLIEASREISKCSSWKELNSQLEKLTKSEQTKFAGDIFELVTKHFLLTDSRYQSTLKNVWLLDEVPENIKLKLNLPDQDEGIDLIAETKRGKFWAIQSKYRSNPNENLTLGGKGGLATFSSLAFRYCKNISHGLVVTTVNRPPKKMRLINDIGFETSESLLSLDDNGFEGWEILKNSSLKKLLKPKKLFPRPHQTEGVNKAIKHFKTNDRGKIFMPCGTGKSLLAFWLARDMEVKTILIAVPSLALIQQTLKTWTRELIINDLNADWLCVCSDNTVKEDQDSFVSFTYDLGIQVTTNEEDISEFLNRKTSNYKIIFTTYQSGKVIAEASKGFSYDLAIMDEAHKTVGHKEKLSAHLIHQKNINIKKRLFMTATERLFRANLDEYLSMNSIKDYGSIIYELSFKKAIEANPPIISDYKIITFNVTDQDIQKIHNDNKFIKVEKELDNITAREFAIAIALRKAIKELDIKKAISFHTSIKRAKNFQKQQEIIGKIYPEYKKLETFHVSGDMLVSKRSSQMRLFAEGNGLMTNARCLTEGVDLPAIDCVCFTDPKRSKIDIVQAAGRALRLSKATNKKFGYILVPLFVPEKFDPETASKDSPFEEIIEVIGALSTHDSRISEYLREITMGRKPAVGRKADGIISINTLTQIDSEKFEKAILIKVWDKIAKVNFRSYLECKEYALSINCSGADHWEILKPKLPQDIPKNVDTYFKKKGGWVSWGSFLETGSVAPSLMKYPAYKEAKKFIQSLNLKNKIEYIKYIKDNNIRYLGGDPSRQYTSRGDWIDWYDFLGTKRPKYFSYDEAKKYLSKFNLINTKSFDEFLESKNYSEKISTHPKEFYTRRKEWQGWDDFLSIKKILSFEEAREIVRPLKFTKRGEWVKLIRTKGLTGYKIPADVKKYFEKEWISWQHFLGAKKQIRVSKLKNYEEIKQYLKLKNITSYRECKIFLMSDQVPPDIPKDIPSHYKRNDTWKSWQDLLNSNEKIKIDTLSSNKLSFEESKKFIKSFSLKDGDEYKKFAKTKKFPVNLYSAPNVAFKKTGEWKGWYDYIGSGINRDKVSYEEAKKYAQSLDIKTGKDFEKFQETENFPSNIPKYPRQYFSKRNEWKSWDDFLGIKNKIK